MRTASPCSQARKKKPRVCSCCLYILGAGVRVEGVLLFFLGGGVHIKEEGLMERKASKAAATIPPPSLDSSVKEEH